ncbi:MAG TPA: hypothetical protein VGI86_14280, partial [Acidimicrobiia bacterium]
RELLVSANRATEQGYLDVSGASTGRLRADALVIASFVPRSRALAESSPSLERYRAEVTTLPGDAAARIASTDVNNDAQRTCGIELVHQRPS